MPKLATPLTDIQVRTAKPKEKAYKLADGGGMYLEVMPTGSKLWRMKFRQANGSESRLAFGSYPEVTLLDARNKRTEARALLAKKIDPAQVRRDDKAETATANANTFEKIAREWHTNRLSAWSASTAKDTINRLPNCASRKMGNEANSLRSNSFTSDPFSAPHNWQRHMRILFKSHVKSQVKSRVKS
jgi:hypothetical protein